MRARDAVPKPCRSRWIKPGLVLSAGLLFGCASHAARPPQPHPPDGESQTRNASPLDESPPVPRPDAPPPEAAYPETVETVEDEIDSLATEGEPAIATSSTASHPLDGWSDEQIADVLAHEPARLGSISIGSPNAGRLWGGTRMPEGEGWVLVDPIHAFGTEETVSALVTCINAVRAEFPDSPPLRIGHLSARNGGRLSPHRSHQSGRDADVGYYYQGNQRWFARATAANLDRARTWAFVRALIAMSDVEMILIDGSLQGLLREHAIAIGEDPAWVNEVFRGGGGLMPLIRHARGHATHLHVRFFSPVARETARRAYPALASAGIVEPPVAYATHRARPGDTLAKLAKRYGTTVKAIQRANGLRSTVILANRTYRIPQPNAPVPLLPPVVVPPRRVPPPRKTAPPVGTVTSSLWPGDGRGRAGPTTLFLMTSRVLATASELEAVAASSEGCPTGDGSSQDSSEVGNPPTSGRPSVEGSPTRSREGRYALHPRSAMEAAMVHWV
ncbi:MAG: penicillin-insensitive murein endopeptidase [Polyangiaceae bacterium]|nr:penicillin-insensitive murein endopeptidase [Polyangiaceae bacterium]